MDLAPLDPEEHEHLGSIFGIARQLVAEIEFENDEGVYVIEAPETRWRRMRGWVATQIAPSTPGNAGSRGPAGATP